jgi:hypothetical protein
MVLSWLEDLEDLEFSEIPLYTSTQSLLPAGIFFSSILKVDELWHKITSFYHHNIPFSSANPELS